MGLKTYSAFIYGHVIDENNNFIDFNDGSDKYGQIEIGSYTLTEFVSAVLSAMNEIGSQEYTASLNRDTRKITISAPSNFDLQVTTGTHAEISAFNLMGFTSDKTGSNSYESDIASGSIYEPQFILQSYVDFEDNVKTSNSSVNQSASGKVEVVSWGKNKFMECNITLATDIIPQAIIKENANGVSDLRDFMNYAINKYKIEFVDNIDDKNVFTSCILESTPEDSKGTAFKLKELYARKLFGYFETGNIIFRSIEG